MALRMLSQAMYSDFFLTFAFRTTGFNRYRISVFVAPLGRERILFYTLEKMPCWMDHEDRLLLMTPISCSL